MKVPYIYINGECLNDTCRIRSINIVCRKIIINYSRYKNDKIIDEIERVVYLDNNDVKIDFKEK